LSVSNSFVSINLQTSHFNEKRNNLSGELVIIRIFLQKIYKISSHFLFVLRDFKIKNAICDLNWSSKLNFTYTFKQIPILQVALKLSRITQPHPFQTRHSLDFYIGKRIFCENIETKIIFYNCKLYCHSHFIFDYNFKSTPVFLLIKVSFSCLFYFLYLFFNNLYYYLMRIIMLSN